MSRAKPADSENWMEDLEKWANAPRSVGFCSAHHQPAPKEFLVVQLLHGAFGFLNRLICTKAKPFERWLCR